MKENKITDYFNTHPLIPGLIDAISTDKIKRMRIEGLSGSSRAMLLSAVFNKTQTTHLAVLPEKEDAAYFYNDLVSLTWR